MLAPSPYLDVVIECLGCTPDFRNLSKMILDATSEAAETSRPRNASKELRSPPAYGHQERHLISILFLGDNHRSLDDALFLRYARSGDGEFEFK
jgi:hypothetical protein